MHQFKIRGCIRAILLYILVLLILIIGLTVIFAIVADYSNPVIHSLPKYQSKEEYTEGEFGDYTDYIIYDYSNIDLSVLNNNNYLKPVELHVYDITPYIKNFEDCVESIRTNNPEQELPANYNFDKSIMDAADYYYLESKEGEPIGSSAYRKFDNYNLYFFDTQSKTLYYFHNNI